MSTDTIDPRQFIAQLNGLEDLESSRSDKYRDFESWIQQTFGARLGIVYLSSIGQFKARIGQVLAGRPDIIVLLSTESFEMLTREGNTYVERVVQIVDWAPRIQAIVICEGEQGGWTPKHLVGPTGSELLKAFHAGFPVAAVHTANATALPSNVATVPPPGAAPSENEDDRLDRLAHELFVPVDWLREVRSLLQDRGAVVFQGPPGTGKTYVARRLAEHFARESDLASFVQLHPSFGYEDFFEGYRPVQGEHGIALAKRPGPLRRIADLARLRNDSTAVMVMDEVNRGNLPKVFGELYFLLEYRDQEIGLMYSPDERFRLPPNLWFIGTMNTSDRSVVTLDQALRRRFHFVPFFPTETPVREMLRSFLDANAREVVWLADLLDRANESLERHNAIGPSHFMRKDIDEAKARMIWKYAVLPSVEEQFFGREQEFAELDFERLRAAVLRESQ